MRLLRRPHDEIETLLGDAITETLPGIVAGAFEGDSAVLFAAIEDFALDEFVRSSLLGAATFLAWDGHIDRVEMARFLERFQAQDMAPPEDCAWVAWADAIALLGEHALVERVRSVFQRELISPMVMALSDFEDAFADSDRAPSDPSRFQRANRGYIEDVLVAPWREIGRNDPCPCGSGGLGRFHHEPDDDFYDVWDAAAPAINKFKKCCLG